jgi:hypothetical protein
MLIWGTVIMMAVRFQGSQAWARTTQTGSSLIAASHAGTLDGPASGALAIPIMLSAPSCAAGVTVCAGAGSALTINCARCPGSTFSASLEFRFSAV